VHAISQPNRTTFRPKWSMVLRTAITLGILAYFGSTLHWAELVSRFLESKPFWLLIACLLFGATFLLASIRWWLLLKVQSIVLPLKTVTALVLIGQFFNSFLLGAMGGDAVKAVYLLRYSPQRRTHAALSIVMDRAMGLFALLCCALAILPWQLNVVMQREESRMIVLALLVLFTIIVVGAICLALIPFHRLPGYLHQLWQRIPRHYVGELLVTGFRQHGKSLRLTLYAVVVSIVIQLLICTAGYCIALAIDLQATYAQMLTVMAIVICAISLPISIGGHGVREGAFVLMFAVFGIITIDQQTGLGNEPAVLFSFLFFALLSVWSLIGGAVYMSYRGIQPGQRP
jgi:uncharacterized protein (TIRG00374 family)